MKASSKWKLKDPGIIVGEGCQHLNLRMVWSASVLDPGARAKFVLQHVHHQSTKYLSFRIKWMFSVNYASLNMHLLAISL